MGEGRADNRMKGGGADHKTEPSKLTVSGMVGAGDRGGSKCERLYICELMARERGAGFKFTKSTRDRQKGNHDLIII